MQPVMVENVMVWRKKGYPAMMKNVPVIMTIYGQNAKSLIQVLNVLKYCFDKLVLYSFFPISESSISCGNHRASTCHDCPQGHKSKWCNGDCFWDTISHQCKRKGKEKPSSDH